MSDTIRWAIRGTGAIAHKFAKGLKVLPDAELYAVGSRSGEAAEAFGEKFDVPRRYADYREMAEDADIDAVYIATPHPMHKEESIYFLKAGKAVLCEKPFCINAKEAEELIGVARTEKQFLMEAMWTRFLPVMVQVRMWLEEGVIGEVRMVTGDFGFRCEVHEEGRLFDLAYGGGALLDVGIYPISLASMVFGKQPDRITGFAEIGKTGVDEQSALVFGYDNGALAMLSSALRTTTPEEARIIGTEGDIYLHPPFWAGAKATLKLARKKPQVVKCPYLGNGYGHEAQELMNCIRAGKLESDIMPLDESLAIMKTMDAVREQWGLKYPME